MESPHHKHVPFVNIAFLCSRSITHCQWKHKLDYYGEVFAYLATGREVNAKDISGLNSDRWIPHLRCFENPAQAKALAGFSGHLSAGFTDSNPAPRGLSLYNQGTKLNGINVPKSGPMFTKCYPAIAKMRGKVYATKIDHYLLMTRLACDQLWAYFLCHNYVPVVFHSSRFHRYNIFRNLGGWLTRLRQHKTSIFSLFCRETQLQLEQLGCLDSEDNPPPPTTTTTTTTTTHVPPHPQPTPNPAALWLPIPLDPKLQTPLDSSRSQSHIVIVSSWPPETDKPHCNIESLYSMFSIIGTIPDK